VLGADDADCEQPIGRQVCGRQPFDGDVCRQVFALRQSRRGTRQGGCGLNAIAALPSAPEQALSARIETHHRNPVGSKGAQTGPTVVDPAYVDVQGRLHAIHAEAGHPWTVPELASLSGLSRPAFARNFERSLGQAPMQYLTDWRMTLARDYLRTGELTLAQIANRTGYASPNAFAAAFRRYHGQPPGQWQRGELASTPEPVHGG